MLLKNPDVAALWSSFLQIRKSFQPFNHAKERATTGRCDTECRMTRDVPGVELAIAKPEV